MAPTLGELAQRFRAGMPELELVGDPATPIHGTCGLSPGEPGRITFLNNPKLRAQLANTQAAAVIIGKRDAATFKGNALVVKDPYLAFARIAAVFDRSDDFTPGVHANAAVAPGVAIPASTYVGPGCAIGEGASIGANCYIGPNTVIGRDAVLGDGGRIQGTVHIGHRVRIGKRVRISAGAVIGGRGFGLARGPAGWEELPQTGTVVLGDDVEIGANTAIDRGALDDTVLGDGVKLDNLIQIAHNVRIGAHTVIAGQSGVAGSARIGARCMIGGASAINGHIEIGDDVVVLGFSMVVKGIPAKGIYGGMPTQEARAWRRELARVARLDTTEARIAELERRAGIEHKAHGEADGGDQDV